MSIEENKKALVVELLKQNAITKVDAEKYIDKIYGKCTTCKYNENNYCKKLLSKFFNKQITMYDTCEEYKCYTESESISIQFSSSKKDIENKKALVDNMVKDGVATKERAEEYVDKIYGKCNVCKHKKNNRCTNLESKFVNEEIISLNTCEKFTFVFEKPNAFKKNDKLDSKPMMHLIDAHFKMELASLLMLGGYKYDFENWRLATKEDISRYRDALERHLLTRDLGEYIDLDTGLPHTICIAFNAMALHYLDLKLGNDDGKRELFIEQLTKYKILKEKQNAK